MRETRDNWANTLSSLGSIKDKSTGATFLRRRRLDRHMVETLVDQNEICNRAVYKIVNEAFRSGWAFKDPDLEPFRLRLESELRLSEKLREAAGWSRLYGACVLALPITDGRKPTQPLNMSGVRAITTPNAIPAHQVDAETYDAAFGSPSYREILSYRIDSLSPRNPQHYVHASRCILFEPIKLPIESRIEQIGGGGRAWGPSVLQRFYDELLRYGSSRAHADAMMYSASLLVIRMAGVADKMTTDEGAEEVKAGLTAIRESLDALGLLGLDKEDEVESVSHTFAGAPDLIAAQADALGAALPMPREIGMNMSETGLRGGEMSGPQALFFADCDAWRKDKIDPAIKKIARLAATAWGVDLGDCEIAWSPLWVPDEKEQSETAERNAKTDFVYWEMGALGAREARHQRFIEGARGAIALEEDQAGDIRRHAPHVGQALEIVTAVSAGTIPRDAGEQMLIAAGHSPLLLGSAGRDQPLIKTMAEAERDDPEPTDDVDPPEPVPPARPPANAGGSFPA
jgi:phage-related protein (TIGR01555 family)